MEKIDKLLRKFSPKERRELEHLVKRVIARDLKGLDCKKLKGYKNIFRLRKGDIRIIFELRGSSDPMIISIERRSETTYKF